MTDLPFPRGPRRKKRNYVPPPPKGRKKVVVDPTIIPPPDERMYTPAEIAARLGVDVQTARIWCRTGKLRSFKYGKRSVRVLQSDLFAFMRERERPKTA